MKDKKQRGKPQIEALLQYANNIIATLREPFLVLDKNLQVISANQAFYTTFKVKEKETTGRLLPDLGDRQWNIPKLLLLLKKILPEKKAMKDYEVEHKFEQIGERTMILNACQVRVPKKIAGIIAAGVREEEGEGGGEEELILLAIEDITERKRLQVELKESEERYRRAFEAARDELAQAKETQYRTLIENLPQKVFLKDRNSAYVSCNENYAKDLKIKPEEIAGKTDHDFFPTYLAEKYRADDKRVMESGQTENIEEEYMMIKDFLGGAQKTIINTVKVPVRDKDGNVTGLFGLFWDITERKRLEETLREADALKVSTEIKSKFTSMVSHELRSPMTVIKEGINLILEGLVGNVTAQQKDILDTAKSNIDRLGRLINNVLDFQKIEAGKIELDIKEYNINKVVLETSREINLLAEEKGLGFTVNIDESMPGIKFDKDKIIQVLTNLLSNAIKFTEKGDIIVSTEREDNMAHIMVEDTGPGIQAEDMPKLFQTFEQLGGGLGKKRGGTGLGLAISKEIIQAHNGKIWAESQFGKGSTFHFVLPIKERRG